MRCGAGRRSASSTPACSLWRCGCRFAAVPHHTRAVILLGGWLLMLPPVVKDVDGPGGYDIEYDAAATQWRHASAHDSAWPCERRTRSDVNENMASRHK